MCKMQLVSNDSADNVYVTPEVTELVRRESRWSFCESWIPFWACTGHCSATLRQLLEQLWQLFCAASTYKSPSWLPRDKIQELPLILVISVVPCSINKLFNRKCFIKMIRNIKKKKTLSLSHSLYAWKTVSQRQENGHWLDTAEFIKKIKAFEVMTPWRSLHWWLAVLFLGVAYAVTYSKPVRPHAGCFFTQAPLVQHLHTILV